MCVVGGQKLNFYLHWSSGILRHGFSLDPRDAPEASPQLWFLDSICSQTFTAQWVLYSCGPVRLSLLENSTGSLTVAMWPPVNVALTQFLVLRGLIVAYIIYVGVKDALWCLYNSEMPDSIVLRCILLFKYQVVQSGIVNLCLSASLLQVQSVLLQVTDFPF